MTDAYGAVPSGATNQFPLLSEGMSNPPTFDKEEALMGQAGVNSADLIAWDPEGGISAELWFEGLEYFWHAAFGFQCPSVYTGSFPTGGGLVVPGQADGSPAPDGNGAYVHVFELDDVLQRQLWQAGERDASSGIAGDPEYWDSGADYKVRDLGVAIDKITPTNPDVFTGVMVKSWSLKIAPGKCSVDFTTIAQEKHTDQAFNQGSWAKPPVRHRGLFTGVTVGIGGVGSSSPATKSITELTLTGENGLESDHVTGSTAEYIQEPIQGGPRTVKGTIKLSRYDSSADDFVAWHLAGTTLQMYVLVRGPQIDPASAYYHEYRFVVESLKITKAEPPVGGPGPIALDVEFEAYKPSAHQTWIDTMLGGIGLKKDNECWLMIKNGREWCWSRDNQAVGDLP